MEAEERPMKLRKLEHSAVVDGSVMAQDDLTNGVPPTNMSIDAHEDEAKNFKSAPADATETNEQDAVESEISESEDNEGHQRPEESSNSALPLSKNALKRIRNKERWDAGRDARKLRRKQKIAEKRIRKRAAREEVQAVAAAKAAEEANWKKKPKRPCHTHLPIAFVIDCGFDDLMTEREMISLGSQLTRSYSDNHKALFQAHLFVSSWGGQLRERFDTVLEKHHENWRGVTFMDEDFVEAAARAKELMKGRTRGKLAGAFAIGQNGRIGAPNDAESSTETMVEKGAVLKEQDTAAEEPRHAVQDSRKQQNGVAEKPSTVLVEDPKEPQNDMTKDPVHASGGEVEISQDVDADEAAQTPKFQAEKEGEVVYLTSDSPHTLERLQPYSTYIIGGLVDKNRHKGICYKTACDRGIKTAKLPIGKFMEMQSRFVLATNHVVEIMLRWLECGDWGQSFVKVMPKRKGGVLKAASGSKQDEHRDEMEVEGMAPRSGDDEEATANLELDDVGL